MFCNVIIFSPKHPIVESKPWLDIIDRSNHAFNPSSKAFETYKIVVFANINFRNTIFKITMNKEIIKADFYLEFNIG